MYVAPNAKVPGLKARSKRLAEVHRDVAAAKERSERQAVVRKIAGAK